ncbi:hypothetical protein GQ602_007186 [Ophiocordyceps camponoti-floridani]|uniref:Cyanovirin-N domain-containing protein n=1 Tax=Ophiocordyceps camponoti-floridani TaxID=2030778 RepID=A0A8H4Q0R4_9HYPO|nr:hypothetical protein GQ602_007186 [Ophiocordyceps camponoti-floridani]
MKWLILAICLAAQVLAHARFHQSMYAYMYSRCRFGIKGYVLHCNGQHIELSVQGNGRWAVSSKNNRFTSVESLDGHWCFREELICRNAGERLSIAPSLNLYGWSLGRIWGFKGSEAPEHVEKVIEVGLCTRDAFTGERTSWFSPGWHRIELSAA